MSWPPKILMGETHTIESRLRKLESGPEGHNVYRPIPEDTAERRRRMLLSVITPLKLLKEWASDDGLLHRMPGLERVIREIEDEVRG